MKFLRKCSNLLSPILIALMVYTFVPVVPAVAGLVTTDQIVDMQSAAADRAKVSSFLEREDVRSQMEAFGVDAGNASERVAALSDSEVRAMAERIDQMPAGQGAVGLIVFVAVVLFVVFIITDMVGATDVFPFVNSASERK